MNQTNCDGDANIYIIFNRAVQYVGRSLYYFPVRLPARVSKHSARSVPSSIAQTGEHVFANPITTPPVVSHDRAFLNEVATGKFGLYIAIPSNQFPDIIQQISYTNTQRG